MDNTAMMLTKMKVLRILLKRLKTVSYVEDLREQTVNKEFSV